MVKIVRCRKASIFESRPRIILKNSSPAAEKKRQPKDSFEADIESME
jgi:hypothetical protein